MSGKSEKQKAWEQRNLEAAIRWGLDGGRALSRAAEVRAQLPAVGQDAFDTLGGILGAGEPVKLLVDPNGTRGCTFTLKTVHLVSSARCGVYLHGNVPDERDVLTALLEAISRGNWRTDKYWKP